jgi:hypothetical protein
MLSIVAHYQLNVSEPVYLASERTNMARRVGVYMRLRDRPMGLSLPANSHKVTKHGTKGITSKGKRIVRNACYIMTQRYGKERLGLLTLTFPTLSITGQWVINEYFHEILRKFKQELTRELKRRNAPTDMTGVVEIQEKRLHRTGECYPHLHLLFVTHGGDYQWYLSVKKLTEMWKRIVNNELQKFDISDENLDFCNAVDIKSIRKDASKYLSKYMSKGTKVVKKLQDLGIPVIRRWWTANNELKRYIKSEIKELSIDIIQGITELGDKLIERGLMHYLYDIEREYTRPNGQTEIIHHGYVGKLTQKGMTLNST